MEREKAIITMAIILSPVDAVRGCAGIVRLGSTLYLQSSECHLATDDQFVAYIHFG
jgi:hypothetical protein